MTDDIVSAIRHSGLIRHSDFPLRRVIIYLWTLPTTCLGLPLLLLAALTRGRIRWVGGVVEVSGPAIAWVLSRLVPLPGGASAMTLGHIVIGRDDATLQHTRRHERVHVRQAERWGPLSVPVYLGASGWIFLRGGDAYRDNPFEREAYSASDP